jgi:HPt (histidine-containing phosphotransfer) domain-containing protein
MWNLATAAVVLNEFEQQAVSDLGRVQTGLACNDARGVAGAAHALKGTAGMLRADELHRITSILERFGSGQDLCRAKQSVDALQEEVRRCLEYLPQAKAIVADKARAAAGGDR